MTAAAIPIIMQGILAAIDAAPGVIEVVEKAKALITALFTAKVINADQQNILHATVDNRAATWLSGLRPPHWTVEPNPS